MADETDNEKPETPEPETPETAVQATEAQADEAQEADDSTGTSQAPAEAAPAKAAEQASAAAQPAEAAEQLSPKERRRRARSTHSGEAQPPRTPEQRHAERVAARRAKAVSRRARRQQERAKAAERRKSASEPEPLAPVHARVTGSPKVRQGVVVSDKAEKTIVVRVDVARRHRRYEKIVRSSGTLHAHDENNEAHEGDVVRVVESRPLSRSKRWKLVDVLERAR